MLIGIDASRAAKAQQTGTENYSRQVIREILRCGTGHRFRLYANAPLPAGALWGGEQPANVEVRRIPFPRLWTHARLSLEMLRRAPDVLFVPSHVLPLIHPRRSVVSIFDLGYLYYPEAHRPADRRYLDWSTRWNARHSVAVLASSQATKADLIRAYGAAADRVRVVYLGRDEALAPVASDAALAAVRQKYGLNERYLLYVGTLQPRKNLARLVEAFALLLGRIAGRPMTSGGPGSWQLVLAGRQGWLYDSIYEQVGSLGLAGRVVFPGYIPDEDLAALYAGSQAFVFPSLYEGFGLPILEAQSCGAPVMASNNSSLPEVAGNAALLVDPHDVDAIADAMYRLLSDEGLRQELIRRGFENVKRFSWEKCARETLAILEEVATEK